MRIREDVEVVLDVEAFYLRRSLAFAIVDAGKCRWHEPLKRRLCLQTGGEGMRVVSERSEAEIRTHEAEARVKYALRRLAANIMRVTRGAGSSAELGIQMVACIDAMDDYRDAAGHGVPSWDLNQMLDPDKAQAEFRPWARQDEVSMARWEAEGTLDCEDAERDVRRACLQIAASMLVNQLPQMNRGETDLSEAIERREAARNRRRAYFQAQLAPAPRVRKKPKPR